MITLVGSRPLRPLNLKPKYTFMNTKNTYRTFTKNLEPHDLEYFIITTN